MPKKNIIITIIIITAVIALGVWWWQGSRQPGKLDDFAKCLDGKGAKFYGAFWCSHCQNQKAIFGSSKKYLPYVECSTPDSNSQLPICKGDNVNVYPTWKFSDGSVQEGELTLGELAEKTGCVLPE